MEFFQDNIPMVTMASAAAALYARKLSSLLRPGFPRQVALLPLFPLLTAAPFAFTSSSTLRLTTSLFLTWLCSFKLALLAAGHGPLDPALPVLKFLFIALLPVKLKKSGGAAASTKAKPLLTLASCMVKVAIIAAILRLYQYRSRLHLYVRYTVYNLHLYCYLDVLFPCIAASASLLGMETVPQFDKPYLASSLRDFWGRRWNLMVSAIFKLSVYDPVRARAGIPAGVLTTFLVSGLMHEGSLCYYGLQRPNGEMTAFFLLHGVCCIAEGWMAQWWTARGWPSPPRAMATLLVILFITATSWWLFTPSLCKDGLDEKVIDAWVAAGAFFVDAARKNGRQRKKLVHSLIQDEGTIEGHEQQKLYITSYYKGMFGAPKESDLSMDESRTDDPQVSDEANGLLTTPYSEEEVRKAVFEMEQNKDGFPAEFYQNFWDVIK